MQKENSVKTDHLKHKHFCARDLQFSVALLIVLALLGGIFLQAISSAVSDYYGLNTPFLGVFLVIGYAGIVVLLAVFYTHRLVGPFARLEYEMKIISAGNLDKRLSIRSKDDLHIRNFVNYINRFVANFEDMSKEYNRLNSAVSKKLDDITKELSKERYDCSKVQEELRALQKDVREFREKW